MKQNWLMLAGVLALGYWLGARGTGRSMIPAALARTVGLPPSVAPAAGAFGGAETPAAEEGP